MAMSVIGRARAALGAALLACGASAFAERCDPSTDRCIAPYPIRYGVWAGDYCSSGVFVKYPPPLSCSGGFLWYADFLTEEEAIQWRKGFNQAWWDSQLSATCGEPTIRAKTDWPATPPTIGQPQSRTHELAYQRPGGSPSSCATPAYYPLFADVNVARYVLQTPCPSGYVAANSTADNSAVCKKRVPVEAPRCDAGEKIGQPIVPATGEKIREELDWPDSGAAPLSFGRIYRSPLGSNSPLPAGSMGVPWRHTHSASIRFAGTTASLITAQGYERTFAQDASTTSWYATNSADTLTKTGTTWHYYRSEDDTTVLFDAQGRMSSSTARNGRTINYAYDGKGQLASITGAFGRSLALGYSTTGQLLTATAQDGRVVRYVYDSNARLSQVVYPDGKARVFHYENGSFPQALTGITDEAGGRYATFAYDQNGKAIRTELAGAVSRYQVSYPTPGQAAVIDPIGTTRTFSYDSSKGKLAVVGGSLPSGTGEADAASRVQNVSGLVTSEIDFKGVVTTTSWDTARRLPLTVTRGSGTPEAVTTTTQWHSAFSLPVLVTEPGRTTAYTHDAVGNVLSKTVTDTATSVARTWSWTYNAQKLIETVTEPNGAVTTYTYDTLGNVLTATNALGHVTLYTYDTANRVASTTAPNVLVSTFTYDLRDRLLTRTVGGQQTTTLTYKPFGSVETLTMPSGLVLTYTYDAAHRLIGWSNNRGESGTFTLDGMGNRTAEQIKDTSGAVAWNAVRSINAVNRVSSRTEGTNQTTGFGYDANGERITETNGLNQSTHFGLDALRRVNAITNAANATATLAHNGLDDVVQAKDFKGVVTSYGRDAQGNATAESSGDTGARSTQYDALGLPSQIVDALGQATTIQRDALGRPTSLSFADGKATVLSYDLTAASKGYLSQIVDRSGTTNYTRDVFGRVVLKRQTLTSGLIQEVGYGYAANGQLVSVSYPGGHTLGHVYDATGRLVRLDWNGNPLVSGITWNPLGQPTGWTWAFVSPSLAASRSYDTAGRMTATEFSSYVYNAAGRITSLTQQMYAPADADPTQSTITSFSKTWSVGYDAVGRLIGFDAIGDTAGFGYDANGNRSSSTRSLNGTSTTRSYTVAGTSNRLLDFDQTIGGGSSTSVAYSYNANGDLTGDGLRTYGHDAEGRLSSATTGATDTSPTTRYAHNALGQRVFKTEPLYPPAEGDEQDPGFFASLVAFFKQFWAPSTSDAEKLGFAYLYDEEGTLLAETGTGGANSSGSTQYIYLPTASGPMPIAAIVNGAKYAVHSDHLNTPRRLSDESGQAVWQWAYSAFGEEKPALAKYRFANLDVTPNPGVTSAPEVAFNLRYPGQYFDKESGLHYNYFRSYDPRTGRYSQSDPIGLDGGWNRFGYVDANPLSFTDPSGLDRWGSYGYSRYIPSTNPSPSFWDRLNFPESPEQRALGQNIAMGFCGSTIGGAAASKAFSRGKQALVDMAKGDKKAGITRADMKAYEDLNRVLPDPFPANKVRLDEGHVGGAPHSQVPHGHVGPVDHIPIRNP